MPLTPPAVRLALFALVLGCSLVAVPTASALTVTRDGNVITIAAAAGEDNAVTISDVGGNARVTEANNGLTPGATLVAGTGCAAPVGNTTDCGAAATVTNINVTLLDLDDSFNGNLGANTAPNSVDFGPGNDSGSGHTGNDTLTGGLGNDSSLQGEGGNDTLSGDVGGDNLSGGEGDDSITGGDGNDSLSDPAGTNSFDAGDGDDSLSGGTGTDTMFFGPGNDYFNTGSVVGPDVIDGGPGRDYVGFYNQGEPLTLSLDGVANDGQAGQNANLIAIESLDGGQANDVITGSPGPDTLYGEAGSDSIDGGDGNDTIYGYSHGDTLNGGNGSDALYGDAGDDAMNGGTGSDLLYGYEGADDLLGGDGRDTVDYGGGSQYSGVTVSLDNVANDGAEGEGDNAHSDNENIIGTGGPDLLVGGPGVNVITGGFGYDTIIIREGGPAAASRDTALCGADEDTVLADPTDVIGQGAEHCENVSYGDVAGYGPVMGVTADGKNAGERGTLLLVLRCPLKARGGCEGTATLRLGGRRAGRVRFSMSAGQEADLEMKLSKRAIRRINKARRAQRGQLTVNAADEIGATSTATKNVKLTK